MKVSDHEEHIGSKRFSYADAMKFIFAVFSHTNSVLTRRVEVKAEKDNVLRFKVCHFAFGLCK